MLLGLQTRCDYRVLNLWEIDVAAAFEQVAPLLLPFVPMLRGGGSEATIRRAVRALARYPIASEFEPLLGHFARFVLGKEAADQIVRLEMVQIEQTAYYREINEAGRQEGRQEGAALLRRHLLRALGLRFGALPPDLAERLDGLTLEQIDVLAEVALVAPTLAEVEARLPR